MLQKHYKVIAFFFIGKTFFAFFYRLCKIISKNCGKRPRFAILMALCKDISAWINRPLMSAVPQGCLP